MNRKVAAFGGFRMNWPFFSVSTTKQLQGNLKIISSLSFQTTNNYSSNPISRVKDIRNRDDALILFDQMIRIHPKPPALRFNKLFTIIFKMGHFEQVILLFKNLLFLERPVNTSTMNILINCYCRLRKPDLGFTILPNFFKLGYAPDIVSVTCLVRGLFYERRVDKAAELFENLLRYKLCAVDNVFFLVVLDGLCKSRNTIKAVEMLDVLEEENYELDASIYNTVINGLCKMRKVDDATNLLSRMIDRGILPDVFICTTLIHGLCKQDKIDHAWTMFSDLRHKGLKPDAPLYTSMMQGLFSVRRCTDALKLFDEMKSSFCYMDLYTYGIVLNGLLNNGLIEDATTFFHEKEREGSAWHIGFYNSFIHGLCDHRQFDCACTIFNNLSSKGLYPDVRTYTIMIKGFCQEGLHQEAKQLLEKMELSGCLPDNITYNVIIQGCVVHCDNQDSIKLLKLIVERDFVIFSYSFVLLLRHMSQINDDSAMTGLIQKLILKDEARVMMKFCCKS